MIPFPKTNRLKFWIRCGAMAGVVLLCVFSASAEVFFHYYKSKRYLKASRAMLMYNAQYEGHAFHAYGKRHNKSLGETDYSIYSQSLGDNFLIWLRHFALGYYDQVHAVVFVWDCKKKIKQDYGFWRSLGSFFTGSKGRALKACQSRTQKLEEDLYQFQRYISKHSALIARVQSSQSRIQAMESQIFLPEGDEYLTMVRIQKRMNRLRQLQPQLSELTQKQGDVYRAWVSNIKSTVRDSDPGIGDVLRSMNDAQSHYNHKNPHSPVSMNEDPFFYNLRKILEDIQQDIRSYYNKPHMEVKVSSLFKHNPISFFKENEEQIQELGRLVEAYTRVEDIHQFVDQWIEKSTIWLAERKGNTSLLDYFSTETEHFTTLTDKIHHLKTIINNELNPQLLMFAHRFIKGTGFFEWDQKLAIREIDYETQYKESVDEEAQDPEGFFAVRPLYLVPELRRNIQEGRMPIYISHWLENYYQSYADPSLVDFLSYEFNIQNYLSLLEKYITSQHKHKKLHGFAEEVKTFLASNPLYGTSPLMDFLNEMESTLVPITTDELVLEERLVNQIQIVRDLFSELKQSITHSYYKTPFVILMNTFQDHGEEFAQRYQRQLQGLVQANRTNIAREQSLLNSYIKELASLWQTKSEKNNNYFNNYSHRENLMKVLNNIHPFVFTFKIHRVDYEIKGQEKKVSEIFRTEY